MSFDHKEFRRALGQFATGVTVVTLWDDGKVHGMTANSFTSVSLDPPLILVNIGRQNRTHDLVAKVGRFAVNILSEDHENISRHFATAGQKDLPEGVRFHGEGTGSPVMEQSLAWLDCSVWKIYDGGDHSIVVGKVEKLNIAGGRPLLFFQGAYHQLP